MLTKLTIRNFKRFGEEVEIELGSPVVFIGPNNSGKTTAMQALALWDIGLRRWNEKRLGKSAPEKRPGVVVNRKDLVSIPVPTANLLWHDLRVRDVRKVDGKQRTSNIRIELVVEGFTNEKSWTCGLEFDYANEESLYCRPLRMADGSTPERMPVPIEAGNTPIAFLPPMSGLAAAETRLDPGAVEVRIGEGRTAEVLRNLCHQIHDSAEKANWGKLVSHIKTLFGSELQPPKYIAGRGEIEMTYCEHGVELDLSSTGRGLQQTLLLLAYMYAKPGAVLLLDEPDAHLEILRQRHIYHLLTGVARESGSQILVASHSEVLLKQAAQEEEDKVIAFVGQKPHRIDNRISQVLKSLMEIEFDQYYLAEQNGWVLYLEGSTDLSILQSFAARLGHEKAIRALERPFVKFVGNQASLVRNHFHGLREACPDLLGVVLFDRLPKKPQDIDPIKCLMWRRREIENYLCTRATLESYALTFASTMSPGPLFDDLEAEMCQDAMKTEIEEMIRILERIQKGSPWGTDLKVSDEFLRHVFEGFFKKLEMKNVMTKKFYYELVEYIPEKEIDPEIKAKLDAIADVALQAKDGCGRT